MATNKYILSSTGDFRSFETFGAYVSQLTTLSSSDTSITNLDGTNLEVRGSNTINSGVSLEFINYPSVIEGNNGSLTFAGTATLNNITLKNLSIEVNGVLTLTGNVVFDNCDITINVVNGILITGNNITINNCTINYNFNGILDGAFVSAQPTNPTKAAILISSLINITKTSNINITNSNFTTSFLTHFPFISFLLNYEYTNYCDINISYNEFSCSGISSILSDNRSVIAFTSTLLTTASFPRLMNVNISNNICNSEQLISLSATLNGSSQIASGIACINTSISNNTCGAICFLTVAKKTYIPADPFLINTDGLLLIENNSCRLIYTGFSSGFINTGATIGVNAIGSSTNIVSGPTVISGNICSWIQTGVRNFGTATIATHSLQPASLRIINNTLSAYDPTYLNSYYNGITAVNTAIIIDGVVGG